LENGTISVSVIKSKEMKWEGHVACIVESRKAYSVLMGTSKGRDHLEDMGIDRSIILKWKSQK
jgi:hypothetical protein